MKNILLTGLLGSLMLMAGCGTSTTNTTTLAQIQAEAAAITSGIDAANALAQESTTLTAAQKATAQQATTTADSAEAVVAALTAGGTVATELTAFDTAALAAMPALNTVWAVNPTTAAAIELGLGLKDAFIAGVSANASMAAPNLGSTLGVVAPIPVPMPKVTP